MISQLQDELIAYVRICKNFFDNIFVFSRFLFKSMFLARELIVWNDLLSSDFKIEFVYGSLAFGLWNRFTRPPAIKRSKRYVEFFSEFQSGHPTSFELSVVFLGYSWIRPYSQTL